MGLFEETDAGADLKRNPASGHFHLEFHGMVVRPVEYGHIMQVDAVAHQFENPLADKIGLLQDIARRRQHWTGAPAPHGFQLFLILITS